MKRFAVLILMLAGLFGMASSAQAAYFTTPDAPPAHSCTVTAGTLASIQTDVNTMASGSTVCMTNGTYAGNLIINRPVTSGAITLASVSGYGAIITGGVTHNGGIVTYQGLDIQNATNTANNGDCFVEAAGVTAATRLQYSKIHNCYRNGVVMKRPACTAPCSPTTGYSNNLIVDNDYVNDVGNTDTSGSLIILRTPSTSGSAYVQNSNLTDTPNDLIEGWGSGIIIRRNYMHDAVAVGSNHNDVFQTWQIVGGDGAQGLPLTSFTMEQNRTRAISGANAHFLASSGAGHSGWTIRWNEVVDIGSGSHAILIGDPTVTGNVTGANVLNNTFYDVGYTQYSNASTGTFGNNIYRACTEATGPLVVGTGTVTNTNNLGSGVAGCTATGTNALNGDPLFASEAGWDFHLMAGSPAHNSGTGSTGGFGDIDNQAVPIGTINRGSDED